MPPLRELVRSDNWWDYKIPPVLAMSFAAALVHDVPAAATARGVALIVFVGLCAGSYGHLINDAFDVEVDRAAGKRNQMAGFRPWQRWVLCGLAVGLGFAPALFFRYSSLSLALLAAEYLLPTLYSVPPVRLKERGVAGVLSDALGAHAVPCLYAISVMANESGTPGAAWGGAKLALPVAGFVWALCLGVKGIVIHEFQDRAADLRADIPTFATSRDFDAVRVPLNRVYAIELGAFLVVLWVLFPLAPILAVAGAAFLGMLRFRKSRYSDFFLYSGGAEARIQQWGLSNPFYESYFPLILAAQVSWRHPRLAFLPVLLALTFASNFRRRLAELRTFGGELRVWLAWRAQLHLDGGAEAKVRGVALGTRLEIVRGASESWHVRLVRPYGGLRASETYRLRLKLRSATPRSLVVGVWQNHAPWSGAGLIDQVHVGDLWTWFEWTFIAPEDEGHAYLGIWLGGEASTVQVRRWSIRREPKAI